ncbi:hypothetical protein F6B93_11705 [Mycobacterium spongiae]|uniref:Uncharacterized protein n=1 Tax=Mycobacterium spongiae TaxID=886343 RepID=A0A975PWX8_9MYCO|nr:hypothetical protein F6B93_11705 [Mycobacterium spongiae]
MARQNWPRMFPRMFIAAAALTYAVAAPAPVTQTAMNQPSTAATKTVSTPSSTPKAQRYLADQASATGPRTCSGGRGVWWRCGKR